MEPVKPEPPRPEAYARGVSRRALVGGAASVAAVAATAPEVALAATRRAGEPRDGTNAAEVFGVIVQDGPALTGYGYLTGLSGVPSGELFAGGNRSEGGARITFAASVQMRERYVRGALFSVIGMGTLAFHLHPGGADFNSPPTFSAGTRIATFAARFHNVLTVIAPDHAIASITGELTQRRSATFTLGAKRYRIGHRGLRLRLDAGGPGTRTDAAAPRAVFDVAGHLTVGS